MQCSSFVSSSEISPWTIISVYCVFSTTLTVTLCHTMHCKNNFSICLMRSCISEMKSGWSHGPCCHLATSAVTLTRLSCQCLSMSSSPVSGVYTWQPSSLGPSLLSSVLAARAAEAAVKCQAQHLGLRSHNSVRAGITIRVGRLHYHMNNGSGRDRHWGWPAAGHWTGHCCWSDHRQQLPAVTCCQTQQLSCLLLSQSNFQV